MAYEFRVVPHVVLGEEMIECWRDGVLVAGIYPHQDGIRIVSKYMASVHVEQGEDLPSVAIYIKRG